VDPSSVKRRLTCILAADAVGYSKQMGQDEEGTIRVLSAHRAVIDGIITFHQGRIVSTAGDSVLAEFSSVVEAVRCAVEIQEALKTRNDSLPEHRQMHFRVGVNLGDVVVKNEDLLGDGVNVAARLETIAEPGGICISSSVYDQITGKLDLGFQDIGEQNLKNISRPIRAYRVSGAAPPVRPAPTAPPAAPTPSARNRLPWVIGAVVAVLIGAAVAWQSGWLRSGSTDGASRTTASAPAPAAEKSAPPAAVIDANATRAKAESDAQRLRSDAEAIKRQAEAELARARSDAETSRAAKAKAEADSTAARLRAQAEADAARIRADAESSAARTKSDAEAAARATEVQVAKARDAAASAAAAAGSDKGSRASPGSVGRFDGMWNVTVECSKAADGALGYKHKFVAKVKDGILRGEYGTEGNPSWLRLQGDIQPDGTAKLDAKGLTGDPKFNVKSAQKGIPYTYDVAARFEGSSGTGHRLQLRACVLTFVKQ
jgi:class 3 adenylate cyclase/F0F1-type ATP synthase membrane subunit b/b'